MALVMRSFALFALGLAAVPIIGCSDSPRGTASPAVLAAPLIGTWTVTIQEAEGITQPPPPRVATSDPDELLRNALRGSSAKAEISVQITYHTDRTGEIESRMGGESRKQSFSWGLLSATSEQIKIDQETSEPPRLERITYKIDSPDKMTIMDGAMQGSSVTRVK